MTIIYLSQTSRSRQWSELLQLSSTIYNPTIFELHRPTTEGTRQPMGLWPSDRGPSSNVTPGYRSSGDPSSCDKYQTDGRTDDMGGCISPPYFIFYKGGPSKNGAVPSTRFCGIRENMAGCHGTQQTPQAARRQTAALTDAPVEWRVEHCTVGKSRKFTTKNFLVLLS